MVEGEELQQILEVREFSPGGLAEFLLKLFGKEEGLWAGSAVSVGQAKTVHRECSV